MPSGFRWGSEEGKETGEFIAPRFASGSPLRTAPLSGYSPLLLAWGAAAPPSVSLNPIYTFVNKLFIELSSCYGVKLSSHCSQDPRGIENWPLEKELNPQQEKGTKSGLGEQRPGLVPPQPPRPRQEPVVGHRAGLSSSVKQTNWKLAASKFRGESKRWKLLPSHPHRKRRPTSTGPDFRHHPVQQTVISKYFHDTLLWVTHFPVCACVSVSQQETDVTFKLV